MLAVWFYLEGGSNMYAAKLYLCYLHWHTFCAAPFYLRMLTFTWLRMLAFSHIGCIRTGASFYLPSKVSVKYSGFPVLSCNTEGSSHCIHSILFVISPSCLRTVLLYILTLSRSHLRCCQIVVADSLFFSSMCLYTTYILFLYLCGRRR